MLRHVRTVYDSVLKGFVLFFGVMVGFIAVTVSMNIFLRLLGLSTVEWVGEVAEYAIYVGAFAAAPWVLRLGLHVRIDILSKTLPRAGARALDLFADTVGLAVCLFIAYFSGGAAYNAFESDSAIYKSLVIPEWPLLAVIPASFLLLAIEFVLRIVDSKPDATEAAPVSGGF